MRREKGSSPRNNVPFVFTAGQIEGKGQMRFSQNTGEKSEQGETAPPVIFYRQICWQDVWPAAKVKDSYR